MSDTLQTRSCYPFKTGTAWLWRAAVRPCACLPARDRCWRGLRCQPAWSLVPARLGEGAPRCCRGTRLLGVDPCRVSAVAWKGSYKVSVGRRTRNVSNHSSTEEKWKGAGFSVTNKLQKSERGSGDGK